MIEPVNVNRILQVNSAAIKENHHDVKSATDFNKLVNDKVNTTKEEITQNYSQQDSLGTEYRFVLQKTADKTGFEDINDNENIQLLKVTISDESYEELVTSIEAKYLLKPQQELSDHILLKELEQSLMLNTVETSQLLSQGALTEGISSEMLSTFQVVLFADGTFKLAGIGRLEQLLKSSSETQPKKLTTEVEKQLQDASVLSRAVFATSRFSDATKNSENVNSINFNQSRSTDVRSNNGEEKISSRHSYASEWIELLRKIIVVSDLNNVEIYLRDYHLSDTERQELILNIKEQLKANIEVKKVVINGQLQEKFGD